MTSPAPSPYGGYAEAAPAVGDDGAPSAQAPPSQRPEMVRAASAAVPRQPAPDVRTLHRTGARVPSPAAVPAVASGPASAVESVAGSSEASAASSGSAAAAIATADTRALAGAASGFGGSVPPADPRTGTVYGRSRPDSDRYDSGLGHLSPLHTGWHCASLVSLSMMSGGASRPGLVIGEDVDHRPVPVRCFRAEPTLLTLVGGPWAAQLLAFRSIAVGARVVILTDDAAVWRDFGARVGAVPGQVSIADDAVRSVAEGGPVLIVRDFVTGPPVATPDIGGWQTQLTLIRRLDERGITAVHDGHLVLTQRLGLDEAMVAGTSLRLTGDSALLLQQLEPDMLAIIGGGAMERGSPEYLWWACTATEHRLLGAARR